MSIRFAATGLIIMAVCGFVSEAEALPVGQYFQLSGQISQVGGPGGSVFISDKPYQTIFSPQYFFSIPIFGSANSLSVNISEGSLNGNKGSNITISGSGQLDVQPLPDAMDYTVYHEEYSFLGSYFSSSIKSEYSLGTYKDLQPVGDSFFYLDVEAIGAGAPQFVGMLDVTSLTLGVVPLPASAPLFGAALLALGALGYSVKRRGQPQTA